MGLFEHWPYTNFHDLNLDWIIKEIPKVFASRDEAQELAESAAESAAASQLSAEASQGSAEAAAESAEKSASSASESAQHAASTLTTASNLQNEMISIDTRLDNIIASGTPTEGNTELIDIRTGFNNVIYPTAGDAVRNTDILLQNEIREYLTQSITIPLSLFIHSCGVNASGNNTTNNLRSTAHSAFNFDFPMIIECNPEINFNFYDYVTSTYENSGEWFTKKYYNNRIRKRMILKPADPNATILKASDITSITITTTISGAEKVKAALYTEINESTLMPAVGTTGIVDMELVTEGDYMGMLERQKPYKRASSHPLIFPKDTTIIVGRSSDAQIDILKNNEYITTLYEGDVYEIEAGEMITIGCHNSSTSATNIMPQNIVAVVKDNNTNKNFTIRLTYTTTNRSDCAFIADGKIFMIARDPYNTYAVKKGSEFIKEDIPLEHSPGHANSCNYDADSKLVYVSDWYTPVIHVYSVDTENDTLTYTKDINLPDLNKVAIEYHVIDNEKQIYFIAWDTYLESMSYGLLIKENESYTLSYMRKILAPIELQGFTIKDNNLIYVNDYRSPYKTKNIQKVNIGTSQTIERDRPLVNDLLNAEGEDIFNISGNVYMLIDSVGRTYIASFVN